MIGFGRVADNDHTGQIRSGDRSFDDYFGSDEVQAVGSGFVISFESTLGSNYESDKTSATSKSTIRESFSDLVSSNVTPEVGLTHSASGSSPWESPDVFVNRYKAADGSWVFHIVNRQIVIPADSPSDASMTSLESGVLDVLLPSEFNADNVSVSFVDADSPTVSSLSFMPTGDRISFTLPSFSLWSVVRVGSIMPASLAHDEPPQSNPYFHGDLDHDGAGGTGGHRPDERNKNGDIKYKYWYWKGGNHGAVPWDVPFFATDDIGLKEAHLYHRYSIDGETWGEWSLYESTELTGTVVYSNFSFDAPDGEGFYDFYTQVVDTSDQEELVGQWAENSYGVDQTAPIPPESISSNGGQQNGYWTTDLSGLNFSWDISNDNLSGVNQYQVSITGLNGSAIVLENIMSGETWTPNSSDLVSGNTYKFRIRVSDNAGNWNSGHDVFDLLYGESPVADVINPAVLEGDGNLTISWVNPDDSNYVGARVDVRPTDEPYASWIQSRVVGKDEQGEVSVPQLLNGVAYHVRVIAFAANNKYGNYVTFPSTYMPDADSDGDGIIDSNDPFPNNGLYTLDSDGDGMPDAWETQYGLDPNDPLDATSDGDNDGISALDEFLGGTVPSGSVDLDGNGEYDALTDGLLLLRGMFGLDGNALIGGTVASNATYTAAVDIESRIAILGDLADIDGNGEVDALTDGLLTLRYLFGLEGDTLIAGVVASDATRTSAADIEAHLKTLMPAL